MLKQLPSGDYIDLCAIIAVRYNPSRPSTDGGRYIRDRKASILLEYDMDRTESIEYESDEEAKKAREDLAVEINQHKQGQARPAQQSQPQNQQNQQKR